MAKLVISAEAISDLEDIWDYIAEDSSMNADRFLDKLYAKCVEITELEGVGRERNELLKGMYSLPFKKYVIFFMRRKYAVEIVRVLHGSRDLSRQFDY